MITLFNKKKRTEKICTFHLSKKNEKNYKTKWEEKWRVQLMFSNRGLLLYQKSTMRSLSIYSMKIILQHSSDLTLLCLCETDVLCGFQRSTSILRSHLSTCKSFYGPEQLPKSPESNIGILSTYSWCPIFLSGSAICSIVQHLFFGRNRKYLCWPPCKQNQNSQKDYEKVPKFC